jgi:acyl-CoA thioesterase FadM
VRRDDAALSLLAEAREVVACVQAGSFRPRRLPATITRALTG